MFYSGASFLNWYKSICNDKMGIKTLPPFESEHLERAQTSQLPLISPRGEHMVD